MSSKTGKTRSEKIIETVSKRKNREKIIDVDEEKVKLVIFTLSDHYFAFYGAYVKEILPKTKISYVPGSPPFILGIINVRGDIESVLDINSFLGLHLRADTSRDRVVIAAKNGVRSGILVDSVEDVLDVPASSIKAPISTLNDEIKFFVIGETGYKKNNVTVLDVGKVFKKATFN